jgi:hypothetical protein
MGKSQLVLYQPDSTLSVEVRLEEENVWLNRHQISVLFDRDIKTIGKHINNALSEELSDFSVVAKFATTAADGKVYQMEYYNLDVILSVGYRVKSNRGIQFRIWANRVLKNYIMKGYAVNKRFERLENRVTKTEEKIDFFVKTALPPVQGIFYEGQIFDAYIFASNLIKSAKKSIILIDNYIDESVLLLLSKRQTKVSAQVYTKRISAQLQLDIKKHNSQYEPIQIYTSDTFHDRFVVIDNTVYFIGASLKDLGKKLFAFFFFVIKHTELLSAKRQ